MTDYDNPSDSVPEPAGLPEPSHRRRRRRPSSLSTSAVDSSSAALGERVTSSPNPVDESELSSSILDSPPVIGWMRAAGLAPQADESAEPDPGTPPKAALEADAPPAADGPRRGSGGKRRRGAALAAVPAPEPEACEAPAPAAEAPAPAAEAPAPAAEHRAPEHVHEAPTHVEETPEPVWAQLAASGASFTDVAAASHELPAADGGPGNPEASGSPALEQARIDQTFDKIAEMATDSIKKLAQMVSRRAAATSGDSPDGPGSSAASPAERQSDTSPVAALAKVIDERPELGVIATFAAGLILATLLKRLARR